MSADSISTPPNFAGINLGDTYGAYLIGAIASALLYGVVLSQTVFYFTRYPKDEWSLKSMVLVLFFLDTLTVIFEVHGLYHYVIVTFGNLENLGIQVWSIQTEALLSYTVMLINQFFFISRIYLLNGRKPTLPAIMILLMAGAFATSLAIVIKIFQFKFWSSSLLPYMQHLVAANKALETAVDALITVSLCYYLRRSRTHVAKTNGMIQRLMIIAINRGAVTTFLQLCYLLAFEIKPSSMAWVALHLPISKVYTNSVLGTLNSRNAVRGAGEDSELISLTLKSRTGPMLGKGSDQRDNSTPGFNEIIISKTVYENGDSLHNHTKVGPLVSDSHGKR